MLVNLLIVLIVILNLSVLVWPLLPVSKKPRWLDFLPATALGLCILEFFLDEFGFRMIPVYLLSFLVFLFTLGRIFRPSPSQPKHRRLACLAGLAGLVWLVPAAAIPLAIFPFHPLPAPSGAFAVGSVTYAWQDTSRPETYSEDPNDYRELPVQFWYPVDKSGGKSAGPTEAVPVSAAQATYPLVIFSPGAFGVRDSNTSTYLELVSHGFIVAAIDHTYQSAYASFPDGRVIPISPEFIQAVQRHNQLMVTAPKEDEQIIRDWLTLRLADIRFIVGRVEELNRGAPQGLLAGRMDLKRIGFIGHSLGAVAMVQFCREDARCQAVVNLDGPMFGDRLPDSNGWEAAFIDAPFPKPLLAFYSDLLYNDPQYYDTIYLPNRRAYERAVKPMYILVIKGSGHMNFTDLPLISPVLANALGGGTVDPERCIRIVNRYALAFFEKHLNGQTVPLLDGSLPTDAGVTFEARNL